MRKLAWILIVVLLFGCATAEGFDFASMSDDQLQAVIDGARNELTKRVLVAAENTVLFEQEGVTVYLTGDYEVTEYDPETVYLKMDTVIVNDSDRTVWILTDSLCINGWEVYAYGLPDTNAGKKQKCVLEFMISDAGISSYEEIEDMEAVFCLVDNESYETFSTTDVIRLTF